MQEKEIKKLLELPLTDLIARADKIRKSFCSDKVELCNILNAKAGSCSEDCKFCAQSGRHKTNSQVYPLKSKTEMLEAAARAKEIGAERFDIVTSGDKLSEKDFCVIVDAVGEITRKIKIKMCASLGSMREEEFALLKAAGLTRYHHNIETSPRFFPKIVSTHTFEDRLKTIKAARRAGLEVCSGGIIGMGETMDDRIQMALILKELKADSVPLNILIPIAGTPLGKKTVLSPKEAIRTIAIFRIILKDKIIKIAAGRESVLKNSQILGFMAGANGMLIGGYLTIKGRPVREDAKLVEQVQRLWQA